MTKGLVKSSKKKQRLNEKFLKDRNPKKELNYEQYETFFNSLKKKSKKKYYSGLIDSYKYNIKRRGMLWKKLLKRKESPMPLFPFLSRWKTEKFSTKKKLRQHLIIAPAASASKRWGILALRHIRDAGMFSQLIVFFSVKRFFRHILKLNLFFILSLKLLL